MNANDETPREESYNEVGAVAMTILDGNSHVIVKGLKYRSTNGLKALYMVVVEDEDADDNGSYEPPEPDVIVVHPTGPPNIAFPTLTNDLDQPLTEEGEVVRSCVIDSQNPLSCSVQECTHSVAENAGGPHIGPEQALMCRALLMNANKLCLGTICQGEGPSVSG